MVIIFSNRKNKLLNEITEILTVCGADFISDKTVNSADGHFTVFVTFKAIEIKIKKGIALILDDTEKYNEQILPFGVLGICESTNIKAIEIFERNKTQVITCGNNHKNTFTLSSINENDWVITLQRVIEDINGKTLYPADYKINIEKKYSCDAVLISLAILLLNGIEPKEF